MKTILIIFLSIFFASQVHAGHLLGGSTYYNCLGNNQYEVKVQLYYGCYAENRIEDTAIVRTYNNSTYQNYYNLSHYKDSTIYNRIERTPCTYVYDGNPFCIRTFCDTLTLNIPAGGLVLQYQRCCRGDEHTNIDSYGTGFNFEAYIPDATTLNGQCNSSPHFTDVPTSVLCMNRLNEFRFQAYDADGDSLVYVFTHPNSALNLQCSVLGGTPPIDTD